jgi:lysophospholipase L1-like esterase
MNFGRSGFTTTEELLALERDVKPFAPDMVVLFFFAENDIEDVSREFSPRAMGPYFDWSEDGDLALDLSFNRSTDFKIRSAINGLKQNSALFSLLVERINLLMHGQGAPVASAPSGSADAAANGNAHLAAEPAPPAIPKLGGAFSLATAHPDQRFQKAFELNTRLLQEIQMKCRQMQARFLLVNINMAAYYPERQAKLRAQDPTFNPYFFDEALGAFAQQNGIPFIGLQKIFEDEHRRTGLLLQYGHWNYGGHRLVASALADAIADIYLKPGTLTSEAATSE